MKAPLSEYVIDKRQEADLRTELSRLAMSYTPEWVFDENDPDIGSVISIIFSGQMAENIKKINQTLGKYRTEFVNLLNISLLPAHPAGGVAVMRLIRDTVPGADIPRGTQLLGDNGDGGGSIVFETLSDIHITNSHLTDIFTVSPRRGKIIPLMGSLKKTKLPVPLPADDEDEEEQVEIVEDDTGIIPRIPLFDFSGKGIEQNALLLYHKSVFNTAPGVNLFIRFTGTHMEGLDLSDNTKYRWSYLSQGGFVPFESVDSQNGIVVLKKGTPSDKTMLEGDAYSLVCLEAIAPVTETLEAQSIMISSSTGWTQPEFVFNGMNDLPSADFMPFGDTASLFSECYLGMDSFFNQKGAEVTLRFSIGYSEKTVSLTPAQVAEQLKIIKRKPRTVVFDTARCTVDKVSFEYYNGVGWKNVPFSTDYSNLFTGEFNGETTLSFKCPDDWEPVTAGGNTGRCIRVRIVGADNCYIRPCLHIMPVIKNLELCYDYKDSWKSPQRLRSISGTAVFDFTENIYKSIPFAAFQPIRHIKNSLYLGFDKKMTGGPVSILFSVDESAHFPDSRIEFEYSSPNGFLPLRVIDNTKNMSDSGTVLFLPPSDFIPVEIEGLRRYWIRIADCDGAYDKAGRHHTVINSIMLNAVDIQNIKTLPEEVFYVDSASPYMNFPLAAENILSAEVWVDERSRLPQSVMKKMLEESPDSVRAEYNYLGDISSFFVLWNETESFDSSRPSDRHYRIDRMNNNICFGDGVNVLIPPAQSGVSFRVSVRCCDGVRGNLPSGAVSSSFANILYIDSISNPIPTYSGSGIESIEKAHERGANIISSRNRLVNELDILREVRAFSPSIADARCVFGSDINGKTDHRLISLVIMTREHKEGSYSINNIRDALKERILSKCEVTLTPDLLHITEPVYVSVSLTVWMKTERMDKVFEIQVKVREKIEEFYRQDSGKPVWAIGELPDYNQIGILLRSVKCDAVMERFIATARYTDRDGVHERDLNGLRITPFMCCVGGEHVVRVTASTQ